MWPLDGLKMRSIELTRRPSGIAGSGKFRALSATKFLQGYEVYGCISSRLKDRRFAQFISCRFVTG